MNPIFLPAIRRRTLRRLFGIALLALSATAFADTYEDFNRAIATDDAATLAKLLKRGFDPNTANERGEPALMTAARESSPEVVKALLQARA
jgi:ankyrin repeat protein